MKFRVISIKTAAGAHSPFRVVEQDSGREIGWINRYLDREYVRRLANKSLHSYPGRAPYGYMHDRERRTIIEHPKRGPAMRLVFRDYVTGEYSVEALREAILKETGEKISKSRLHELLKSRFYIGFFTWRGTEFFGTHPKLVDNATFLRVQQIIAGRNSGKLKRGKHAFAFSGLLTCSRDGCAITAEQAKGKYNYYRCSFGKGRHKVPYMPESKLAGLLNDAIAPVYVPEEARKDILAALRADEAKIDGDRQIVATAAQHELAQVDELRRQAYKDKALGKIDEALWASLKNEWIAEIGRLQTAIEAAGSSGSRSQIDSVAKIIELTQITHNKYLILEGHEQGRIAKIVLSNCSTDGVSLSFKYREPFDLIFERARNEEWRRDRDSQIVIDNNTFIGIVGSLSGIE